jgi:hypothetical protein
MKSLGGLSDSFSKNYRVFPGYVALPKITEYPTTEKIMLVVQVVHALKKVTFVASLKVFSQGAEIFLHCTVSFFAP